jgi:hypothetical protein
VLLLLLLLLLLQLLPLLYSMHQQGASKQRLTFQLQQMQLRETSRTLTWSHEQCVRRWQRRRWRRV